MHPRVQGFNKNKGNSSISDMALFTRVQDIYIPSIESLHLFINFCQMFRRCRTPSACPCLLMFRINRPRARISSSLVSYREHRSGSFSLAKVDPGGPVVIILASESEVRGFDSGRVDGFFSQRKNPEYDFLRKGSKAVGPVS